jgi:ferredoxin
MIVHADKSSCQGHARCQATAPDVFVLDEDGYISNEVVLVPEGSEEAARRGVLACPERVFTIADEE